MMFKASDAVIFFMRAKCLGYSTSMKHDHFFQLRKPLLSFI
jgi:hypothetical protein